MNQLRGTSPSASRSDSRPEVRCTVYEGAKVYTNVALHLKGSLGSFRPLDDNPGLTLKFDRFVPHQTFHGLKKISLNNSVQDPSFLNEKICRELFTAAGIPVPRSGHATVRLNGRDLGMHVLVEGWDKQFLKQHFQDPSGVLYDGGSLGDITTPLEVVSGVAPPNHADLRALAQAAATPIPQRMASIQRLLDLDEYLTVVAMDILLCNWDGYSMDRNNYRIYHDPTKNRLVFMPHGLDHMLGERFNSPRMSITPAWKGLVTRGLDETPEFHDRLRDRLGQLFTNAFNVTAITNRLDEIARGIRPIFEERGTNAARLHDWQVQWVKTRVMERAESIREQFSHPRAPLQFDANGEANITDWRPQVDQGYLALSQPDASSLLLVAQNGGGVGSFRTHAVLARGTYRMEGRIKTEGITVITGTRYIGGASLRSGWHEASQKLTGTTDWRPFICDFGISNPLEDIDLVCELRAITGSATFDTRSLRLIKR